MEEGSRFRGMKPEVEDCPHGDLSVSLLRLLWYKKKGRMAK